MAASDSREPHPDARLEAQTWLSLRLAAAAASLALALLAEPRAWRQALLWAAAVLAWSLMDARRGRKAAAAGTPRRRRLARPGGGVAVDFMLASALRALLPLIPNGAGVFVLVFAEAAWRLGRGAAVGFGVAAAAFETALARVHPARPGDFDLNEELFRASLLVVLALGTAVAVDHARQRWQHLRQFPEQALLAATAAMDSRDAYASPHAQPVALLAARVARAMGLGEAEVQSVYYAALLHDLGKLGVPEAILARPGALTPEEWRAVRRYPQWGAEFLQRHPGLRQVAEAVRHQGEHWDGSGYPDGLAGEAIPLPARIIRAADVYLALCSNRPYRPALSPSAARQALREMAGRTLDPRVVETLLRIVAEDRAPQPEPALPGCPPGSAVHRAGAEDRQDEGSRTP